MEDDGIDYYYGRTGGGLTSSQAVRQAVNDWKRINVSTRAVTAAESSAARPSKVEALAAADAGLVL